MRIAGPQRSGCMNRHRQAGNWRPAAAPVRCRGQAVVARDALHRCGNTRPGNQDRIGVRLRLRQRAGTWHAEASFNHRHRRPNRR
ncbi:hypothetical protein XFF6992_370072 [Xanthomonas citri pv. fuscans]|nr:hypothetical protein XFF6992_370072 [Xanthomonas citri pv. fuscans]SOO33771.1 hypothetical protein XFF6994_3140035 [Xanthomonas citri pv. fuscans]